MNSSINTHAHPQTEARRNGVPTEHYSSSASNYQTEHGETYHHHQVHGSNVSGNANVTAGTPPVALKKVRREDYVFIESRQPVTLACCPSCARKQVATSTKTKATGPTAALVGFSLVVFWPLCWVPLVLPGCKQTNHYCTNCGVKVGRVKPQW